jgi:methylated-DNA-[protein]-cysteine S-methyltransferase
MAIGMDLQPPAIPWRNSPLKQQCTAENAAVFYTFLSETPAGSLLVAGDADAVTEIRFLGGRPERAEIPDGWEHSERPLKEAVRQLKAYFSGRLQTFDLAIRLEGTAFQRRVWQALRQVPFGETASYGQIARAIGRPTAARAIGAANGRNRIPIIVPCHRIIGSDGTLVGFGGGLGVKRALLRLEGICC